MKIGILTIGNELTTGRIQDTNSAMIARAMHLQGWTLTRMMSVGDNNDEIHDALEYMLSHVDVVIVTGGLGPTADDITTAAVAKAFGLELYTDEATLAYVKDLFAKRGLPWTENNAKQAVFPEGAKIITNPLGTAAGFAIYRDRKVVTVIPGVPREAEKLTFDGVIPIIREAFPDAALHLKSRTFRLFGIAESAVDQALSGDNFAEEEIGVGFYPHFPENHLVITVRETSEERAEVKFADACKTVEMRLGKYIFARDDESLAGNIARLLTEEKLSLSLAESCTGGLIADSLTDIPGSSGYFERGVVSYSNEAKTTLLKVPAEVIAEHGAVSEETARLMAEGIRNLSGADLGLAVTGIAGPSGGTDEKPVGTTFIALALEEKTFCRHYKFRWNRRWNKVAASQAALLMLWRHLKGESVDAD
jgi:nicotinamide-nucleotide amidase